MVYYEDEDETETPKKPKKVYMIIDGQKHYIYKFHKEENQKEYKKDCMQRKDDSNDDLLCTFYGRSLKKKVFIN